MCTWITDHQPGRREHGPLIVTPRCSSASTLPLMFGCSCHCTPTPAPHVHDLFRSGVSTLDHDRRPMSGWPITGPDDPAAMSLCTSAPHPPPGTPPRPANTDPPQPTTPFPPGRHPFTTFHGQLEAVCGTFASATPLSRAPAGRAGAGAVFMKASCSAPLHRDIGVME
jgi:hypothetical protein